MDMFRRLVHKPPNNVNMSITLLLFIATSASDE